MPTTKSIIPLQFWPESAITLKGRWRLLPGVALQRLRPESQKLLDNFYKTFPTPVQGGHNFAVVVDREAYLSGLSNRNPGTTASSDWLIAHDLGKLTLLSVLLVSPIPFRIGPEVSGQFHENGQLIRPVSITFYPCEQTHFYRSIGLHSPTSRASRSVVVRMMLALERYFRMDELRVDRIGAALAHLWSSLCTPYLEQALLSACAGLEALTTTGDKTELTHLLSERLAYLLAPPGDARLDLYKTAKNVYGMRSAVVHGTYLKRGQKQKPWPNRIIISPKFKVIGDVYLREATNLLLRSIRAYLSDQELMTICAESNDDQGLRDYYERRLFKTLSRNRGAN